MTDEQLITTETLDIPTAALGRLQEIWDDTFAKKTDFMETVNPPQGWAVATSRDTDIRYPLIGISTFIDPDLIDQTRLATYLDMECPAGDTHPSIGVFRFSVDESGSLITRVELSIGNHRIFVHQFEDGVCSIERYIVNLDGCNLNDVFMMYDAEGNFITGPDFIENFDVEYGYGIFTEVLEVIKSFASER